MTMCTSRQPPLIAPTSDPIGLSPPEDPFDMNLLDYDMGHQPFCVSIDKIVRRGELKIISFQVIRYP